MFVDPENIQDLSENELVAQFSLTMYRQYTYLDLQEKAGNEEYFDTIKKGIKQAERDRDLIIEEITRRGLRLDLV